MNAVVEKGSELISFDTSRFGAISVPCDKVINFVQGIPGFGNLRKFIIIDHDEEGRFKWLQSLEDPAVAFLMTSPALYKPDYKITIKKADAETLGIEDPSTVVTLVMVSALREQKSLSINLKGPVIFNSANMKAIQCIVEKENYPSHFEIKVN